MMRRRRPSHTGSYRFAGISYVSGGLDREDAHQVDRRAVDGLGMAHGLGEGHIDDLPVLNTDHHVALPLHEGFDGRLAHARGDDAVDGRG